MKQRKSFIISTAGQQWRAEGVDPMEVQGPMEAVGAEADIASRLQGVLVEELSPIQTTLQVSIS
jgi:hypothetical protein